MLSTGKYRALVERAQSLGFEFRLIYVFVQSLDLQLERIRARVEKGGHDVPFDKVRERRARSFRQAGWFFERADTASIYDNSGRLPELVGSKSGGRTWLSASLPSDLLAPLISGGD